MSTEKEFLADLEAELSYNGRLILINDYIKGLIRVKAAQVVVGNYMGQPDDNKIEELQKRVKN